jgi:hypothetical protein
VSFATLRRGRALAALATIVVAAGALAYWTAAGSGSATTQLGAPGQLTLTPGTPTAQLYPGGASSVAVVATNPNPYPVRIGSLELDTDEGSGFEVDAVHGGCDASVLSLAPRDNGGAGWSVPPRVGANNGSLAIDLTGALTMDVGAANECQGATFTVYLVAGS